MTLPVQSWRVLYNANGSQTSFSIPQSFFSDGSTIVVKTRNPSATPPAVSLKVSGTDYNVTGTNVVFVVAPTTGYVVGIFRVLDIKQDLDFDSASAFPAESLETRLDKHAAIMQQLQGNIDRALKVADTAPSAQLNFLIQENFVASALLAVSADGTGVVMGPTTSDLDADVAAAAASATAAGSSATAAAGSASAAATSATTSATSATASATSATASSTSATAAASSATAAAASAVVAGGAAGFNTNNTFASPGLIAAAGTIGFTAGYRFNKVYAAGNGAARVAGNIQAGVTDGDSLLLIGADNTNTLSLDTTGRILTNGQCILGANSAIAFNWDAGQSLWIEVSRNEI